MRILQRGDRQVQAQTDTPVAEHCGENIALVVFSDKHERHETNPLRIWKIRIRVAVCRIPTAKG